MRIRAATSRSCTEFESITPAPHQVNADIISSRFRHSSKRIRMRVTFTDLRRHGDVRTGVRMFIRTNEGIGPEICFLFWGHRPPFACGACIRRAGSSSCAIHRSVDYRNNIVVLGFPRRCISSPRWVRIGVFGVAWLNDRDKSFLLDDAQRDGSHEPIPLDVTLSARISPRLGRGQWFPESTRVRRGLLIDRERPRLSDIRWRWVTKTVGPSAVPRLRRATKPRYRFLLSR